MMGDQQYMVRQEPLPAQGPMTKDEAEYAVKQIRRSLGDVRRQAVEFDERKGWAVLTNPATGKLFGSMKECIQPLFGISRSRFYQQLNAARIQENLSTKVDNSNGDDIPERVLRPLAGKPKEVQQAAWEAANAEGRPSALSVRRAVEKAEGTTTTRSNPSQLFTARGEPNATQEPEGGLDLEPDTAPMSVAEMAAAQREFENRGLGSDATQEPEGTRSDAGTGQARAEASLRDAGAEEGETKAAGFVYTMDPGLDDWLVGEIDRAYLRGHGLDLTALITLARLTISRSTDQTRAAMVCRGLLDDARGRK